MKKLIQLLTEAELEAKRLADATPASSAAQVLRAKVRHALEFTESPVFNAPAPVPDSATHN